MDHLSEFLGTTPGLVALLGAAFAVGWALFSGDRRIEERRRRAGDVSRQLAALGFKKLPLIFADYSIGDYSGMLRGIHELHDILADPAQRQAELAKVFELLIKERLADPDKLNVLQKLVDSAKAAFDSGDPAQATGELAQQLLDVVKSGTIGGRLLNVQDSPLVPGFPALSRLERLASRLFGKEDPPSAASPAAAS